MISVIIADDHEIVRRGVVSLLRGEPDVQLLGEAADGVEAVRLTERFHPQVLITDIQMPGLNGLEVARAVARSAKSTRVVVFSMHASESYVLEALRSGASGYVLKTSRLSDVLDAVRQVASGGRYLSAPLADRAIEAYQQQIDATGDVYETLTTREREVLALIAQSTSNAEIAARLFISTRTVETHRAHLMRKLGLRSHTDIIIFALRHGIIQLD